MTHIMEVLGDATHGIYLGGTTGLAGLDASYSLRPLVAQMLGRRSPEDVLISEVDPSQQIGDLDLSDVKLEKVAALKAQIESGTYHVSAADLADRLIISLMR